MSVHVCPSKPPINSTSITILILPAFLLYSLIISLLLAHSLFYHLLLYPNYLFVSLFRSLSYSCSPLILSSRKTIRPRHIVVWLSTPPPHSFSTQTFHLSLPSLHQVSLITPPQPPHLPPHPTSHPTVTTITKTNTTTNTTSKITTKMSTSRPILNRPPPLQCPPEEKPLSSN